MPALSSWFTDCHSPDGLHHARVSQLSRTKLSVEGQRLLEFVWLNASDKERLALTKSVH